MNDSLHDVINDAIFLVIKGDRNELEAKQNEATNGGGANEEGGASEVGRTNKDGANDGRDL